MIQLLRKCLYIFQLKVIPQSVKNLVLSGYWNHITPPPKKPLINARHVVPSEVMSRRLVKSHLEKRNDCTTKGGQPTPIIKDSSDISNTSALEPGGQVYQYWARPGPTCLPDA